MAVPRTAHHGADAHRSVAKAPLGIRADDISAALGALLLSSRAVLAGLLDSDAEGRGADELRCR